MPKYLLVEHIPTRLDNTLFGAPDDIPPPPTFTYEFTVEASQFRAWPDEIREFILVNMYGRRFNRWVLQAFHLSDNKPFTVSLNEKDFEELARRMEAQNCEIWPFLGRS